LLIWGDWSKFEVGKCETVLDFTICRIVYDKAKDGFVTYPTHIITDVKNALQSTSAIISYIEEVQRQMAKDGIILKYVIFVSDGGPADFKMTSFQAKMFQIQCYFPDMKLDHIVHAPYHGWGPCDGAKAQAQPVVTHWGQFNHKKVGKQEVIDVCATVKNHTSSPGVISDNLGEGIESIETNTFHGILSCFHFRYEVENNKILGFKSSADNDLKKPIHIWTYSTPIINRTKRIRENENIGDVPQLNLSPQPSKKRKTSRK
jgi:hypothetical protein